jgi:hypothetical protein
MADNFDTNVAECHRLLDSIAAMTGRHVGDQSIVSEYTALNSSVARLTAEVQILKRDNNRLKMWIATI